MLDIRNFKFCGCNSEVVTFFFNAEVYPLRVCIEEAILCLGVASKKHTLGKKPTQVFKIELKKF